MKSSTMTDAQRWVQNQTAVMRRQRLNSMSKEELQARCKELGIPVSSNKIEMRHRLFNAGA